MGKTKHFTKVKDIYIHSSFKIHKDTSTLLDENQSVLYSSYKGLFINVDESFIPHQEMKRLEGLPVSGDSGGGFFIKKDSDYQLISILSATLATNDLVIEDTDLREQWKDIHQPILPLWQDIRPHLD